MEKRITKEIILKYEKDSKGIYCSTNESFKLIWGTATNPFDVDKKYGVIKKEGKYYITTEALMERKKFIEGKIKKLTEGLKILNEALE